MNLKKIIQITAIVLAIVSIAMLFLRYNGIISSMFLFNFVFIALGIILIATGAVSLFQKEYVKSSVFSIGVGIIILAYLVVITSV